MKTTLIFVCILVLGVSAKENTLVADLPTGVAEELITLLTNASIDLTGGCDTEIQPDDVIFRLYTRHRKRFPIVLNKENMDKIGKDKYTVLIIHGWISTPNMLVPEMSDAYLSRYDCNVITVDWSKIGFKPYTTSVCYLPEVAKRVADFLCNLDEAYGIPVETVHLVGHSLGGQMSGLIGQETKNICKKTVGRITGLDPAGPLFYKLPIDRRLDKSDASFVDVIHTNGGVFGYLTHVGHVDFYVNCGTFQLGCPDLTLTLTGIMKLPVSVVICHHLRSVEYMTESISIPDSFIARSCQTCPIPCLPDVLRASKSIMGEDTPEDSTPGGYVLTTNLIPPYGSGFPVNNIIKKLNVI